MGGYGVDKGGFGWLLVVMVGYDLVTANRWLRLVMSILGGYGRP